MELGKWYGECTKGQTFVFVTTEWLTKRLDSALTALSHSLAYNAYNAPVEDKKKKKGTVQDVRGFVEDEAFEVGGSPDEPEEEEDEEEEEGAGADAGAGGSSRRAARGTRIVSVKPPYRLLVNRQTHGNPVVDRIAIPQRDAKSTAFVADTLAPQTSVRKEGETTGERDIIKRVIQRNGGEKVQACIMDLPFGILKLQKGGWRDNDDAFLGVWPDPQTKLDQIVCILQSTTANFIN